MQFKPGPQIDPELKRALLVMGGFVEKSLDSALQSLFQRNSYFFQEVETAEKEINRCHLQIDHLCEQSLARHRNSGPLLRHWMMAVKMNSDLERVGDQALNIAQTAKIYLLKQPVRELKDLKRLAADTQNMLKDALDSLAREDATLANNVIILDDLVSNMTHRLMRDLRIALQEGLYPASSVVDVILILRNLEKISHHALNIAGHTIWALTGQSAHSEDFAENSSDSLSAGSAPPAVPLDPL